jgi:hypothetical protein
MVQGPRLLPSQVLIRPSASSKALGQVPRGSGLGVNAEDHGSWPMRWSFLYRIPYRIWFATSHQEVETKIIFPLFRLFRGNGSWCRISRIQSPSHHIISELKSSLPKPSKVEYEIFFACDPEKPGCGRPVLPSASSEAFGQDESSNPQRSSKKMGDLGSGEDRISPIPLGRDGEWKNGKITRLKCPGR